MRSAKGYGDMGIVLAWGYYLVMLIFIASYIQKVSLLLGKKEGLPAVRSKLTPTVIASAAGDIILLRRLFFSNAFLWFGEWLFHSCLALLMVRHLRYFLEPAPSCVFALQTPAFIAAFLLLFSLIYIFIVKLAIEKKSYVASSNFFLLTLLLLSAFSGLLMKIWFPPDLEAVKFFAMGIVTFRPVDVPHSPLFIFHFVLFLIVFAYLPTHIAAAPVSLLDARQREKAVRSLMHEK
jgi:nitrate reductase gamma subunit